VACGAEYPAAWGRQTPSGGVDCCVYRTRTSHTGVLAALPAPCVGGHGGS
jgi:hypothetical protein